MRVHGSKDVKIGNVNEWSQSFVNDFREGGMPKDRRSTQTAQIVVTWTPPKLGIYKLNTDATINKSREGYL